MFYKTHLLYILFGVFMKRVQVTFTDDQWELIIRFKGVMGSGDAEIVRNIVLAWLAEKSIISKKVKDDIDMLGGKRG